MHAVGVEGQSSLALVVSSLRQSQSRVLATVFSLLTLEQKELQKCESNEVAVEMVTH